MDEDFPLDPVILPGAKVRVEFPNLTAGVEVPELVKEQVEAHAATD